MTEGQQMTELTEKELYAQELVAYALGERPDCPKPPEKDD